MMGLDRSEGHRPQFTMRRAGVAAVLLILTSPAAWAQAPADPADSPTHATKTEVGGTSTECLERALIAPCALITQLSDEQKDCLRMDFSGSMTLEEDVERRIAEADPSDPLLCYTIALYLSQQGWIRADEVVRWAEFALERRRVWEGEPYTARVSALLQVRAIAAMDLWVHAEGQRLSAPSDDSETAVGRARLRAKTFARQWYGFTERGGVDSRHAMQLCLSTAATHEYCEDSPTGLERRFLDP